MIKKIDPKFSEGTSFWGGYIRATYNQLCEAFGEPQESDRQSIWEKVQVGWTLGTSNPEIPFTIYDWKEYREWEDTEVLSWHVGSFTQEDTGAALVEVWKETQLPVHLGI
jgi:hypothetical protein